MVVCELFVMTILVREYCQGDVEATKEDEEIIAKTIGFRKQKLIERGYAFVLTISFVYYFVFS